MKLTTKYQRHIDVNKPKLRWINRHIKGELSISLKLKIPISSDNSNEDLIYQAILSFSQAA